jgi:hypothetical protein
MICKPPASILPMEMAGYFERFIRQVLNTDKISNKPINAIRYSYLKQNNLVLWGIGCLNRDIGIEEEFCSDCKHRSNLRSFVGIVFDMEQDISENGVPFDTSFFKLLFDKYVVPYWNFEERKQWETINSTPEVGYGKCNVVYSSDSIKVNLLNDRCYIFSPNTNIQELIASVLNKKTNLVTGLNVASHIDNAAYSKANIFINNAVCLEEKNTMITFSQKIEEKEKEQEEENYQKETKGNKKQKSLFKKMKQSIGNVIPKKDIKNKELHIEEELEEISLNNNEMIEDVQRTPIKTKENPVTSSENNIDKSLLMPWGKFEKEKENITVKQEIDKSLSMNWDDFGSKTESEQELQVERNELSIQDSVEIEGIEEIGTMNNIADKYKKLMSSLIHTIDSINNYQITTTKYDEIEFLVHDLIEKLKNR